MPLYRHLDLQSRYVTSRPVDVWLPAATGDQPLPVIYMHDGQNLFDPTLRADGEVWAVDQPSSGCALPTTGPVRLLSGSGVPISAGASMRRKSLCCSPADARLGKHC